MITIFFILMSFSLFADDCRSSAKIIQDKDFQVSITQYISSQSKKSILIIPPTGGTNYLDRSYAENFCESGMNSYILENWTGDDEYNLELSIHQRFYARAQKAIKLLTKHLPQGTIGILGTSVGALHASIAAGLEEQIKTGFFITGGADIAEIIVDSDQETMQTAREKRNLMYGFKTREDYLSALRPLIELDPIKMPEQYIHKRFGLVLSLGDTTVPTKNQKLLEKIIQPKKLITLESDHFWSIIKTWLFYRRDIAQFFIENL